MRFHGSVSQCLHNILFAQVMEAEMGTLAVQGSRQNKEQFHRNLVVKVESYDVHRSVTECYPGTLTGIVAGGPLDGQRVDASIRQSPSNANVTKIKDFMDRENLSFTESGGYVALSSVRATSGKAVAGWANKFANPDADLLAGVPIRIAPVYDAKSGTTRKYSSNNATVFSATALNTGEAESPPDVAGLYDAISQNFANGSNVYLAQIYDNGRRVNQFLWHKWRDGQKIPVDEAVLKIFCEPNQSNFENCLIHGGQIDVVPVKSYRVSSLVAAAMDQGRTTQINERDYRTGGLGARVELALKQNREVDTQSLEKELLSTLSDRAKSLFAEFGWRGVRDSDIRSFFQNLDIQPQPVPLYGYASSTVMLNTFAADDGEEVSIVCKSRPLGPTVPSDFIPTPSAPDAIGGYFSYFRDLVKEARVNLDNRKTSGMSMENCLADSNPDLDNTHENEYLG